CTIAQPHTSLTRERRTTTIFAGASGLCTIVHRNLDAVAPLPQGAAGLQVPRAAGIAGEITLLDRPLGPGVSTDPPGPVGVDPAAAQHRGAALVNRPPGLGVGADIAVEKLALAARLHRDAELATIVNPAAADERIALGMDRNLGGPVTK